MFVLEFFHAIFGGNIGVVSFWVRFIRFGESQIFEQLLFQLRKFVDAAFQFEFKPVFASGFGGRGRRCCVRTWGIFFRVGRQLDLARLYTMCLRKSNQGQLRDSSKARTRATCNRILSWVAHAGHKGKSVHLPGLRERPHLAIVLKRSYCRRVFARRKDTQAILRVHFQVALFLKKRPHHAHGDTKVARGNNTIFAHTGSTLAPLPLWKSFYNSSINLDVYAVLKREIACPELNRVYILCLSVVYEIMGQT